MNLYSGSACVECFECKWNSRRVFDQAKVQNCMYTHYKNFYMNRERAREWEGKAEIESKEKDPKETASIMHCTQPYGVSESIGFQRKLNPKCEELDEVLFIPGGLLSFMLMGPERFRWVDLNKWNWFSSAPPCFE